MNTGLPARLAEAIEARLAECGKAARIVDAHCVGGGCINDAQALALDDGRRLFLKSNAAPLPGMFEREAQGLSALADVASLRVPRPLFTGTDPLPFIVLEHISEAAPNTGFAERFGRGLAALHRRGRSARFGFDNDNYIGATPQQNGWDDDWVVFFRERRLRFQLDLARQRGGATRELSRLGDGLLDRLDELLAEPAETPCLLHGDLWGGNYLCDDAGEPVLIDPAVYFGRREADLAMTMLFGRFDPRFYSAYEEAWPLAPGSDERLAIYKLYHLLNHLNLFGGGYLGGCLSILRRFS